MIIAARTLNSLFDFTPPAPLLLELAAGTETLRVKTKRNTARIMEANQLVDSLIGQHRAMLVEQGYDTKDLTAGQKRDQCHHVLENLVVVKARAHGVRADELMPMLDIAAKEMGVYDIVGNATMVKRYRKIIGQVED
jgi:hypothetical protein